MGACGSKTKDVTETQRAPDSATDAAPEPAPVKAPDVAAAAADKADKAEAEAELLRAKSDLASKSRRDSAVAAEKARRSRGTQGQSPRDARPHKKYQKIKIRRYH